MNGSASQAGVGRIGITDHAQQQLGDVVFVELPKVGSAVTAGARFGTVESVKAVSELFSPVTGKVTAVNDELAKKPETVNSDPYGAAWMIEVQVVESRRGRGAHDRGAVRRPRQERALNESRRLLARRYLPPKARRSLRGRPRRHARRPSGLPPSMPSSRKPFLLRSASGAL